MTWRIQLLPLNGPLFEGAIHVYGDAFIVPPYSDPDRGREVRSRLTSFHSRRPGYLGLVAVEDGNVVGMCYGYHSEEGQWWHDVVADELDRSQVADWMTDAYELVEIAVDPNEQNRGIGAALIRHLLQGQRERACLLSTRSESEAHRLYSRLGFEVLTEMTFGPGGAPFYIMGARLPLAH